jgi:flavorubredoxin
VKFHEATFLDAPVSMWMTETETETLFPVDWMGFIHLDDERLTFVDELDGEFDRSRLVEFHGRVLFWYQYIDVEKTNREIDNLIQKFDPEIIAPAHGLVIREDATDYMAMMKDVTRELDSQERIGTLG